MKVTAVENTHFKFHYGLSAGKYKSYSYRFDTPDRSIVFTGDSGESDLLTELAQGADLFVTETVSFKDRMQRMIASGQWQAMTPSEQAGIQRQATQGHMTPEIIGKTAARAGVKMVVLSHLTYRADGNYYRCRRRSKAIFFRSSSCRQRLGRVLKCNVFIAGAPAIDSLCATHLELAWLRWVKASSRRLSRNVGFTQVPDIRQRFCHVAEGPGRDQSRCSNERAQSCATTRSLHRRA